MEEHLRSMLPSSVTEGGRRSWSGSCRPNLQNGGHGVAGYGIRRLVFSRRHCSWTICAAGSDKLAIVPADFRHQVNISAALSSSANPYDANSAANKSVATKLLY